MIGAQRTGTNILREILNTNDAIAMLGEVLSPSPAPAHWDNFCRRLPPVNVRPMNTSDGEALLDQYFDFVQYRIHNHWEGNLKSRSHAIGVDIKYNQLRQIAPVTWIHNAPPFLVGYLRSRGATLIHTTRRNVIHCAISAMIASQRNVWHNYQDAVIDRSYHIDVEECLAHARKIVQHRDAFLAFTKDCDVVNCCYEDLVDDIARAGAGEEVPDGPGPLRDIAEALRVPFGFRYDRSLQKAINIPYSRLLANRDALVRAVKESEFSQFASALN
ncbi:MAG TPA: hypothetical protein VIX59_21540 [Candidatus Binataceae bacterium]